MILKKAKNSRSQYFNYSNYLCTACNTAIEKLLKVDFEKKKKKIEEIKEKEQDEDDYQQTPIDNELEMMLDNLLNKLCNSDPNSVSYEKWAQLISVIVYKVVNKNIYEDGKEI